MEKEKKYIIGEESKRLLNALEKFQEFQNTLTDALISMYGEDGGAQFFNEHKKDLDNVERIVMEYLRINFTTNMGFGNDTIEL